VDGSLSGKGTVPVTRNATRALLPQDLDYETKMARERGIRGSMLLLQALVDAHGEDGREDHFGEVSR
jgi:hypothetical protein